MNTDDIIRMAREAGFDPHDMSADFTCNLKDIERFAALVAAAEREKCAKVAAWILKMPENDVSAAIRARGNHENS